ncbi:MAG TPA: hypothetical protein DCD96_00470 [Flavobacteriales bacterium]|nr:hypothetical protein [Flavobacteriales bacterium]
MRRKLSRHRMRNACLIILKDLFPIALIYFPMENNTSEGKGSFFLFLMVIGAIMTLLSLIVNYLN